MTEERIPNSADFTAELLQMLSEAESKGLSSLEVRAGHLHERVGGYPGPNHRMPACCDMMRKQMRDGDTIVKQPPKGRGATLTIRYRLPR